MTEAATLIPLGSIDILLINFRILLVLDKQCLSLVMKQFQITWSMFKEFSDWLGRDKASIEKMCRSLNNKITPIINECLHMIFSKDNP